MLKLSMFQVTIIAIFVVFITTGLAIFGFQYRAVNKENISLEKQYDSAKTELAKIGDELEKLKNEDQYKKNEELQNTISQIEKTYADAMIVYETIDDLEAQGIDTNALKEQFVKSLNLLSQRNYQEAQTELASIQAAEDKIKADIAAKEKADAEKALAEARARQQAQPKPQPADAVSTDASLPGDGDYKRFIVTVDGVQYTVSIIAASLSTTKVQVDTATSTDCDNGCPVYPLADYVNRNGAFAGVNGSYFCPSTYPSCVNKTGSFDFLAINKDGTYFNESEIGISSYPAVVFRDQNVQFISELFSFQKDSSITSLLTNYPLLVHGYNLTYTGGLDNVKITQKGNRSFVANIGKMVYIGTLHNVSMTEAAKVLHSLGMENALNLDDGGSTALWYDGSYKLGPGRNLPNTILFIKK